ncbi:MAG: alternative ribosome rescue aminoacyl-tRNA hydrolase ArfB [Daejeonella sp.]
MNLTREMLLKEISFKTSRSGGKGGQNVNKVSSKAELNWLIQKSDLLTDEEKKLISTNLASRINVNGILQVISEEERSQLLNKDRCIEKLLVLIKKALYIPKLRKSSKPKKSAIEKRLKSKQMQAMKKISRKNQGSFE